MQGIGGALELLGDRRHHRDGVPEPAERAKAMSAYVFVAVGGGSVGLLAGGVLTQALSWHWIFFVNVPVGIATLIAGSILLVDNIGLGIKQGVDWVGSVLVTASVMVVIYAIVTVVDLRLGLGPHARPPRPGRRCSGSRSSCSSRGCPSRSCRCAS